VPIALKSGSLKLLELSGPVQACNVIAFLFLMINLTYLARRDGELIEK
jgi:hypothetical protein